MSGMQILTLTGLRFDANLGILDHEKTAPQPISVDAQLNLGPQPLLPRDDDIMHVLDYRKVRRIIIDECTAEHVNLLESLIGSEEAFAFRPHVSVGYRNILGWDSTPAAMRFLGNSAATSFTLNPGVEPEDALVAGLGLNVDSQFVNIRVGYDAEISDNALTHYGSVTLRMAFW